MALIGGLSPRSITTFHVRPYHRLPVQCSVYFHTDSMQGTGTPEICPATAVESMPM